jgi:hypothetical protein
MKCEDARSAYLSGAATSEELRHLETCGQCRDERDGLDLVLTSLRDGMLWDEPAPGVEDQLVSLIESGSEPSTGSRPNRPWWIAVGVAAALVAAVFAAWTVTSSNTPDWEVALPGTSHAPQAAGVVRGWNESGGTRLALSVTGLPAAPAGSVYELWFSEGSRHISSGTFVAAGDVELWVGVARRDFPRLWITLEPLDANESPSPVTVMDTG